MPIYEFVCEACGRLEERLQKLTDPPPEACPECGAKMAKIMSRNSFQLKGGGWYRDLYSSAGGSKPATPAAGATEAPAAAGAAVGDAKPAATPAAGASAAVAKPNSSAPAAAASGGSKT
jgi:putative FmdB family regulatory protein